MKTERANGPRRTYTRGFVVPAVPALAVRGRALESMGRGGEPPLSATAQRAAAVAAQAAS